MDVNGMEGGNPAEGSLSNDLGMDLSETGAMGSTSDISNPLLGESGQSGQAAQPQYKFAGKEYPSQAAAEAAYKKLYGNFSESRGILNTVKEALKDPELLEALAEDPKWASILAKLGIDAAQHQAQQQAPQRENPQEYAEQMRQWQVERDVDRIEREEYRFERELGRALSPEERRATLDIIRRAESLTFKEAYQLSQHERLLAEAGKRNATAPRQVSNRPAPPPSRLPGSKVSTQKRVQDLSPAEWKENVMNDPDFRELLSRQTGR